MGTRPRLQTGAGVTVGAAVPVKIHAGKGVHGNWADPDPPKLGKPPSGSSVTVACLVIVVGTVSPWESVVVMTNEKPSKETERIVVEGFPRESVPVLVTAVTGAGGNVDSRTVVKGFPRESVPVLVAIVIWGADGVKVTRMTDVKEDPWGLTPVVVMFKVSSWEEGWETTPDDREREGNSEEGVIVATITAVLVTEPKLFVSRVVKEKASREDDGRIVPDGVGVTSMTVVKLTPWGFTLVVVMRETGTLGSEEKIGTEVGDAETETGCELCKMLWELLDKTELVDGSITLVDKPMLVVGLPDKSVPILVTGTSWTVRVIDEPLKLETTL
jgi:hypothetical protein